MDEVKWIKLKVGLFDGASFKRIKNAQIGGESFRDKLTAVWFELLDLGAKCNNNGFLVSDEIPFSSIEDIAIMIDRSVDELNLCLAFYEQNKMIEIIDNVYYLSNWCKYQNVDGLEKIREQNRLRQQKHRQLQKSNVTCNVTVTQCHAPRNKNKILELDNIYINAQNEGEKDLQNTANELQNEENAEEKQLHLDDFEPKDAVEYVQNETEKMFDIFWKAYPKKINKKGSFSKFSRIKNLKDEFPKIMDKLNDFKESKEWKKENGQFIPYPETWLNQERWKDETEILSGKDEKEYIEDLKNKSQSNNKKTMTKEEIELGVKAGKDLFG